MGILEQLTALFWMLLLLFFYKPEMFKIKWDKVAEFLAFMAILTVARISIGAYDNASPETIGTIKSLLYVFLEDAFFVVPIVFLQQKFPNMPKWLAAILWIYSSALFGWGHLYQGWFAACLLSLYPYFISRRYGIRNGFGTVMICHVLYDFITVASINLYIVLNF